MLDRIMNMPGTDSSLFGFLHLFFLSLLLLLLFICSLFLLFFGLYLSFNDIFKDIEQLLAIISSVELKLNFV